MQLLFTTAAHCVTRATFQVCPSITRKASCQTRLDTMHVQSTVRTKDAGPVHGLQRSASCAAVAGAKSLETVAAARVHHIRELVHAIAGLQARWLSTRHTREPSTKCNRQSIRLPGVALPPPQPHTEGNNKQPSHPWADRLLQPPRTAQSPSRSAQKVTIHGLAGNARE